METVGPRCRRLQYRMQLPTARMDRCGETRAPRYHHRGTVALADGPCGSVTFTSGPGNCSLSKFPLQISPMTAHPIHGYIFPFFFPSETALDQPQLGSGSYHVFERHLNLPHCSAQGTDPGPRLLILQTWRSTCLLPLFVLTQTPAIHCSNFNRGHCNKTAVFLVQCKAMSSSTTPRHSSILGEAVTTE